MEPRSENFGRALEHLVFLELKAFLDYKRLDAPLSYWRTHTGYEVDFLLGDTVAIEVKSSRRVSDRDLKGLRALSEEARLRRRLVVCTEPQRRRTDDGIDLVPVSEFFDWLWQGDLADGL